MTEMKANENIQSMSLLNRSIEDLDQVTDSLIGNISDSLILGTISDNWSFIGDFISSIEFMDHKFNLSDEKNRRVYYYGVWKTLFLLLKRSNEFNENILNYKIVNSYKHMIELIKYLHTKRISSHSELAESLNISPNSLSNLIKRVSRLNLMSTSKVGKQKIYKLTNNGLDLFKYIVNNNSSSNKSGNNYFVFAHEILSVINHETASDSPKSFKIVNTIDKYANMTMNEKRLCFIQAEAIVKRIWLSESVKKLDQIKTQEPNDKLNYNYIIFSKSFETDYKPQSKRLLLEWKSSCK